MSLASNSSSGHQAAKAADLKGSLLAPTIAVAGILLTGLAAGGALSDRILPTSQVDGLQVAVLDPAEIAVAGSTLAGPSQSALLADAKSCRAPIAVVTLSKQLSAVGGTIRIRSGSYLSPAFKVEATPQRIAIPFPAPYSAGRGTISVEGAATGVQLSLTPTWSAPDLVGRGFINLVWQTNKPCGA